MVPEGTEKAHGCCCDPVVRFPNRKSPSGIGNHKCSETVKRSNVSNAMASAHHKLWDDRGRNPRKPARLELQQLYVVNQISSWDHSLNRVFTKASAAGIHNCWRTSIATPEAVRKTVWGGAFKLAGVGGAFLMSMSSRSEVRSAGVAGVSWWIWIHGEQHEPRKRAMPEPRFAVSRPVTINWSASEMPGIAEERHCTVNSPRTPEVENRDPSLFHAMKLKLTQPPAAGCSIPAPFLSTLTIPEGVCRRRPEAWRRSVERRRQLN
jgi:hypothetical protein